MSLLVEGVALTPSGRPVLAPEELELRMIERVDVEFGDKRAGNMRGGLQGREADKYVAGVALVTSHRLIWLDQARAPGTEGLSCSVHLSRVIEAAPVPLKMFGSRTRRLRLALRRGIVGTNDAGGALVLAFRGENPDAFTAAVADALASAGVDRLVTNIHQKGKIMTMLPSRSSATGILVASFRGIEITQTRTTDSSRQGRVGTLSRAG